MSAFDFATAVSKDDGVEAYNPATQDVLQSGNYVVKITELENTKSSGGYPMLKLTLENEQGRQWDNLVISPNEFSVAKLLGLIDSAGLPRPDVAKGEMDPETGRLDDAYAYLLERKTVGVIVRDEEDNRPEYAGQTRPRVKGYVAASVLSSATTGPLGGSTSQPPTANDNANANTGRQSGLAF